MHPGRRAAPTTGIVDENTVRKPRKLVGPMNKRKRLIAQSNLTGPVSNWSAVKEGLPVTLIAEITAEARTAPVLI